MKRGWMTSDERVFYDRAEAARHEAVLEVGAILTEKLDLDGVDVEPAVMALAHPDVIKQLRALAPKQPRKPRAKKEAS